MLKRFMIMVFAALLLLGIVTVDAINIVETPPETGTSTTFFIETYDDSQPGYTGWLKFTVTVLDEHGNPLSGVLVSIRRKSDDNPGGLGPIVPPINGSNEGGYVTGPDGKLVFRLYPADTKYLLSISQEGYEPITLEEFSISSDAETTIQLVKLGSAPSPSPSYSGGVGPTIRPEPSSSPTVTPTVTPTPSSTPTSTPMSDSTPSPSPSPSEMPNGSDDSSPAQSSEPAPTASLGEGIVIPPMDVQAYEIILEQPGTAVEDNEPHHPVDVENRPPSEGCAVHWWMFPWIVITLVVGLIRLWYLTRKGFDGTDKHEPEEKEMIFK